MQSRGRPARRFEASREVRNAAPCQPAGLTAFIAGLPQRMRGASAGLDASLGEGRGPDHVPPRGAVDHSAEGGAAVRTVATGRDQGRGRAPLGHRRSASVADLGSPLSRYELT